jgi:hypothetical protein
VTFLAGIGVGGEHAVVRVQTDLCGVLDIREGITAGTVDDVAAVLTEGETYVHGTSRS